MACPLIVTRRRGRQGGLLSSALRPYAFRSFLNSANIRKVLRPARSKLGCDKIVLRNKEGLKPGRCVNYPFNPAFPCRLKIDARKVGENIEASRIASKTKEAAAVCEFLRPNALQRDAILGKRCAACLRVRRVCFYEKIDFPGKTWLRVKR